MRKTVLISALILAAALIVAYYPVYVPAPVKDGPGPLAIRLDPSVPVPEYHNPLTWWQTNHMDVLARGDLNETDCRYCHVPQSSCNNCHAYVGVKGIQQ